MLNTFAFDHLHSICQLCHLFLSLLLKSNEKVIRWRIHQSALYFWDHHTPIACVAKHTEALDTTLVYL